MGHARARARLAAAAALAATAVLAAACTTPHYSDGGVQCSASGACPAGFACNHVDNRCWRNGGGPQPPDGGGSGGCVAGTTLLCDDFEADTLDPQWSSGATEGTVTVDTSRAHQGSRSLHLHTNAVAQGTAPGAVITESRTFPQSTTVYVRLWAYYPSPIPTAFQQIINLVDAGTSGIAFAIRDNATPVLNAYTAPLHYTESAQFHVPVDRWTCLELAVDQGAQTGQVHLFIDDTEVSDAAGMGVTTTQMVALHLGLDFIDDSGIGAADLWIDDVRIGTARIGCSN